MVTRVTNSQLHEQFLGSLRQQLFNLGNTQRQVSTGERFSRPAQDPVAASQVLSLTDTLDATGQYVRNANLARSRLGTAESALASATDILQRIRELTVQSLNGTETPESRRLIAAEVRQQLDGLLQIANTRDGNGEYLFAGYATRTQPFVRDPAGVVQYNGDQGQRLIQIGPDRFVADSDSGAEAFQLVRNGNGTFAVAAAATNTGAAVFEGGSVRDQLLYDRRSYTIVFPTATTYEVRDPANVVVAAGAYAPGTAIAFSGIDVTVAGVPAAGDSLTVSPSANQDVFASLGKLLQALESSSAGDAGIAAFRNVANAALQDIDQGIGRTLDTRSSVGGRLAAIEQQESLLGDLNEQLQSLRSQLKDTDYAEALSRLEQQMLGLEAAQKSFVRMQGLSLFQFI